MQVTFEDDRIMTLYSEMTNQEWKSELDKELPQLESICMNHNEKKDLCLDAIYLSRALSARGQMAVLEGEPEGWLLIERAAIYYCYSISLLGVHVPASASELSNSLLFLYSINFTDETIFELGVDALYRGMKEKPGVFNEIAIPSLAIQIGLSKNSSLSSVDLRFPYADMFQQSELLPEQFDREIEAMAEYHLSNCYLDDDGTDEFMRFSLLPTEIFFVCRFLKRDTNSNHSLLQTSLSSVPKISQIKLENDKLASKFLAFLPNRLG